MSKSHKYIDYDDDNFDKGKKKKFGKNYKYDSRREKRTAKQMIRDFNLGRFNEEVYHNIEEVDYE